MNSQLVLSLAKEKEWGKLVEMGYPAVSTLMDILYESEILRTKFTQEDIKFVKEALVQIGKPHINEIINIFSSIPDEEWGVLLNIADVLGEIGDTRAVEPLINSLEENGSKASINYALAKLGDERAVEPLIKSMKKGSWCSVHALGMMKSQEAVETLIDALTSEDSYIRIAAAKSLGMIGDKRAVAPLIKLLRNDREMWACANAAWALGEIGDPDAIHSIKKALADKNFTYTDDDYHYHDENPAIDAYKEALKKLNPSDAL